MSHTTIVLNTRDDIVNTVPVLIGYHPTDSLVLLSIGGGAHVRIDLPTCEQGRYALTRSLRPLVQRWSQTPVIAVVFTDNQQAADGVFRTISDILRGIPVLDMFRVHDGNAFDPYTPPEDPGTPLTLTVDDLPRSRAELAERTRWPNTSEEAEQAAVDAYLKGDGALAHLYLDRGKELTDKPSEKAARLRRYLLDGTPPDEAKDV